MQTPNSTQSQYRMPDLQVLHDCSEHHRPVDPKAGTPLVLRSHGCVDLGDSIYNNIYRAQEVPALQQHTHGNFLRDYSSADTDKMTLEELQKFLLKLAGHIDKFYFHGCLVGDEEHKLAPGTLSLPLLKIRVFDKFVMVSDNGIKFGACPQPIPSTITSYIDLFMWNLFTGKRVPKIFMLTALVHGLCHLYFIFFNCCPVEDEAFLVRGPRDDDHGPLWEYVHSAVVADMRRWDDQLATLGESLQYRYPPKFYISYLKWAKWVREAQRHWDVTDVRFRRPQILFGEWRRLPWRQERKEEFRRALLRLTYASPDQFTMSHVPSPDGALRAVKRICSLASVAAPLCYLYFDSLEAIAASYKDRLLQGYRELPVITAYYKGRFIQDYRDDLLHRHFWAAWGIFLIYLKIVWEALKEGFWSFRDSLENQY
ncbi:hypothetical protein ANO14919_029110 [Xylariales sp. No.14919]|nr:hypothetical protein ANO14919_029110 [Xylariales sp. No.14919]